MTGEFVIEEVEEEGDSGKKEILRRLIFLSNANTIQSEARLIRLQALVPVCYPFHRKCPL